MQLWIQAVPKKKKGGRDPTQGLAPKTLLVPAPQLQCDKQTRKKRFLFSCSIAFCMRGEFFFLKESLQVMGGFFRRAFLNWERQGLNRAPKRPKSRRKIGPIRQFFGPGGEISWVQLGFYARKPHADVKTLGQHPKASHYYRDDFSI